MRGLNPRTLRQTYYKKGYPFYEGTWNVNIFGFRDDSARVDEFNDVLGVHFQDDFGKDTILLARGTTKPGLYYLKNNLGGIDGTFILKEGYYKKCWKKGKHAGKYDALKQSEEAEFIGWRDNDKDGHLDYSGDLYTDVTGLNFHTTSFVNEIAKVGAYSAGCQVVQDDKVFEAMRAIIYKSMEKFGGRVSYALFNIRDFFI